MPSIAASPTPAPSYSPPARVSAALERLADEVFTLIGALLSPGRIIRDVEAMRALQLQAGRIDATDPAQAVLLRRRASRIGLRRPS